MDTRTLQVAQGWTVVDPDGKTVGDVTATREDHIVVSSGTLEKRELYIPIDHLAPAGDGKVKVSVPVDLIEREGWRYPPNAPFKRERPAYPEVPETTTIQAAGYSAGRLSAPEPQGAVLDDQTIDRDEVPAADIEPDEQAPGTLEETDRT
jgi:hypothetical protein